MFFISWGSEWSYKRKKGYLSVEKLCPECDKRCEFVEVVPTKHFTLFWIPVFETETKKPLLECTRCQSRFYIQPSDYAAAKCIFECEHCSQKLRVPQKDAVISVRCPTCGTSFKVKDGIRVE
jgi:ribosomal protein L33